MGRAILTVTGALAAAVAVFALSVMNAGPASAHAFLVGSNPANGSSVAAAPGILRLDFSESVVVEATHVEIIDSAGNRIVPISIRLVGAASSDTEEPASLAVALPRLPRSAYTVSWRTLSSDDLHRTQGVIAFGVGQAVHAAAFHEPTPKADEALLRWAMFVSLALALGAALWGELVRRLGSRERASGRFVQRDIRGVGRAGAIVGIAASATLLVEQLAASGTGTVALFESGYGGRWLLRALGFVLLALAFTPRMQSRYRVERFLVGFGALAACVGSALLGHSATGGVTRTAADALHLASAATWAGVLLIACLSLAANRRDGARDVVAVLREFRGPALVCVGLIVVTGVYLASGVVGSVDAALLTNYGRVLLLKLSVFGGIVVLGLINTRRLHSPGRTRLGRRNVLAEACLAVLVLGLAAVLTAGQPAMERQFISVPQGERVVAIQSGAVGDLQESVAVQPNRPGHNVVIVDVYDTRRPAPAPITGVRVRSEGQGFVAATALGDGRWSVGVSLGAPGKVLFNVQVQRAGAPVATRSYDWVVAGVDATNRPSTLSSAPLQRWLTELAAMLGAVFCLACVVAATRRRREVTETPRDLMATSSGSG